MPIPNDRTTMGQKFSDVTISHEDRLIQINLIKTAVHNLYAAIDQEIHAETLAQHNEPIDPTWDNFRANGTTGDPLEHGINDEVQDRGAELYDALAALPA